MSDLFGSSIIPGLALSEYFVSADEEQALIGRIDGTELTPFRFRQWTGKRLTRSFGWSYDFETGRFAPAEPIPGWLDPLRVHAAGFAGLEPAALVQALLIRYDPGAVIGWHRDRPVFEHVIGVSLGSPAVLRFRRRAGPRFARASVLLEPRSIYHLSGEVRHEWEHSIAELPLSRWSVTFRSLSAMGAAAAGEVT